jgi:uncharacterized membrane protein
VTGWMGENHFAALPTAGYGMALLLAAIAYTILVRAIIAHEGPHSRLGTAVGRDVKGYISLAIYVTAIVSTLVHPGIAQALYVVVALIWLVPDPRIEKRLT